MRIPDFVTDTQCEDRARNGVLESENQWADGMLRAEQRDKGQDGQKTWKGGRPRYGGDSQLRAGSDGNGNSHT